MDNNTLEVVVESQITRKQDAAFDALRGLDNPGMIDSSLKVVMLWREPRSLFYVQMFNFLQEFPPPT